MKKQRDRYGAFHVPPAGQPHRRVTDLEVNRWILMNEGKGLVPGYPRAMTVILGEGNVSAVHGPVHRVVRGALMSDRPGRRERPALPTVDEFIGSRLYSWGRGRHSQQFFTLLRGPSLPPVNLPGTAYRRGLQGGGDILSFLLREKNDKKSKRSTGRGPSSPTSRPLICSSPSCYTGFEAVSSTVTMAVKYLHDHPSALKNFGRAKSSPDEALTWEDYTSMSFTHDAAATIVNGLMRKTTKDIPINGEVVIPKGWRTGLRQREQLRRLPEVPDVALLRPWRWRLCLGKELAMVEISLFLYYFLTRYSSEMQVEETGGDEIVLFPRVEAPRGLHIRSGPTEPTHVENPGDSTWS
ncbi:unnamed protein product [Spirodela intermedia]|uniref:Uncharacterized protein n=1 Tax=Spirodela intermedia TaxID=51605 RepID=A0A7I8IPA7_SPIIN|nr:unnamed protein product [Spirodela intermedia]CAA6659796.1 unnamed protein product [Spirodela intermedia]